MKFTAVPKITTEKITKDRIFQLVRVGLYTLFFTAIIIHLNEFDNQTAGTTKETQGLIAFIFFMLFLLALQKAKFLNIPSLVVTLVMAPVAVLKGFTVAAGSGSVILTNAILTSVVNWLAFLLIADMVATKRVRKWNRSNLFFFAFFALVGILMVYQRSDDIVNRGYLYFLLFFLVKTDDEEWGRVTGSILNAGVLSFAMVLILSFVLNPQFLVESSGEITNLYEVAESEVDPAASGRWYGYFLNIGTFGQFLGLQTALAFLSIIRSKERFGRLSIPYFVSYVWLGAVIFTSVLVGTSDYMAGVILLVITVLVFGFKKTEFPRLLIRALVMMVVLLLLGILLLEGIDWVLSPNFNPAVLQNIVDKSPLRFFPSGAEYLIRKISKFHDLRTINGAFISSPLLLFLNYLGATRPAIWRVYLEYTTFQAGDSSGLPYQRFFDISAHSQYVQELFTDGYFVGGLNILLYLSGFAGSIAGYVKTKAEKYFAPMILFPVMLGMWVGERSTLCFALTFVTAVMFLPLMDQYKYARPYYFGGIRRKGKADEEEDEEEEPEEEDAGREPEEVAETDAVEKAEKKAETEEKAKAANEKTGENEVNATPVSVENSGKKTDTEEKTRVAESDKDETVVKENTVE